MIEKLGPEASEEDNLNASSILQDALETKEFYTVVSRRNNVSKMLDYALPQDVSKVNVDSQNAALGVLTQLVSLYTDRKKEKERRKANEDEDEETTVQQSDEEEESAEGNFLETLASNIPRIVSFLELATSPRSELETSYEIKIVPLGSLRLKLIEFLYHLMKLNKDSILVALGHSSFFEKVSSLIETYPWNNFLHLKAIALYEDLFECPNIAFRKEALHSSNIGQTLVTLANKANFDHSSGRSIR